MSRMFGFRAAREACLLLLVGAVTAVTATDTQAFLWMPASLDIFGQLWMWLPIGGAMLVTLLRLRSPVLAVVGAALLFGWWPATAGALAVTAFEAATPGRPVRWRATVLGVAALAGYVTGLLCSPQTPVMLTELHLIAATVCLALPAWMRALLDKADRVLRALRERAHYLEANYRLAHTAARLQERSRIAQETHDQLGHRLSLITLYAGALELERKDATTAGTDEARLIRHTAQTAMRELRTILGILRPVDPEEAAMPPVTETGTHADVRRLVNQSRSAGVDVRLVWRGADLGDAAPPVRWAVHRIVREGLTNVHRHAAGSASTVVIERGSGTVRAEVCNECDPEPHPAPAQPGTGLGLVGVRERVRLLGGEFAAGRTPDGGFRLAVEMPLCTPAPTAPSTPPPATGGPADRPAPASDRWPRYGAFAALAASLVGAAALMIVVLNYLPWYSGEHAVGPVEPQEPRIGMTRAEVVAMVNLDDPVAALAARELESPPPAGGDCTYGTEWSPDQSVMILRYCFRADRLITLDRFPADDRARTGGP